MSLEKEPKHLNTVSHVSLSVVLKQSSVFLQHLLSYDLTASFSNLNPAITYVFGHLRAEEGC